MADVNPTSPTTPRRTRPGRLFDSPDMRASAEEIGTKRKISRKRIEDLLHEQLRRLWVAPAEEFARLQIARLDAMILKLIGRVRDGDLEAMDRTLMIINSLDRLPGFIKAWRDEPYTEEARTRLLQKLNDAAARLQSEPPVE